MKNIYDLTEAALNHLQPFLYHSGRYWQSLTIKRRLQIIRRHHKSVGVRL